LVLLLAAGQPKDAPKDTWLEYLDDTSREWATGAFKQLGVDVSSFLVSRTDWLSQQLNVFPRRQTHGFTCELLWRSGTWTYTQVVSLGSSIDRSQPTRS
jgi:hypothetical protein